MSKERSPPKGTGMILDRGAGLGAEQDLQPPRPYLEALVYLKEVRPSIVVVSILPASMSVF